MNLFESARIARILSLAATVSLTGCYIEGGAPRNDLTPPTFRGCPSLDGGGSAGLIALSSQRGFFYSLESYAFPGYYVRHTNSRARLSLITTRTDKDDATFRIVPGLADDRCISFEARNYPGSYLRHQNSDVVLSAFANDGLMPQDATFCPRPGLADDRDLSFETCNYPGEFLNQFDDFLYVDAGSGFEFEEDATFTLDAPWSP